MARVTVRGVTHTMEVPTTDLELYARGIETALACWEQFAHARTGAAVTHLADVTVATSPDPPEAVVYNNAVLRRGLAADECAAALDAMEHAYAACGITRFAAWAHESDTALLAELDRRGYRLDEWTRAMGLDIGPVAAPADEIEDAPVGRHFEVLAQQGAPPELNERVDPAAFHALVAWVDGDDVATAMAFDLDDDCGIYNVVTHEAVRRRGLGTALMARLLADACARGCRTASLQSSPMAVSLYAAMGFRDLGRILEYVR